MILRNNYRNAVAVLKELGVGGVDGIVLDLGVSSYQFDTAERGFSYRHDTALDMRMDQRSPLSAKEIVNGYPESELFHIIKNYGEEPFAKNIAKHIVREREKKEITTTFELNEIIRNAIPECGRVAATLPGEPTRRCGSNVITNWKCCGIPWMI